MATYLQGVTDYIPEFQPFQPDLNFYQSALQTKQTQYDKNYKALNNLYGQYFYSELTREPNVEKKDKLLKDIDFQLKKVSGLDLSLEQNVEQATQVFRPFYENKFLMKDMAWTKNYRAQKNRAEGLRMSADEKQRAMHWAEGDKELDYRREEFKNTTDDESLGFENVQYTPFKNPIKTMMDLAKDSGISMDIDSYSEDGTMIIREKNGKQILAPLYKFMQTQMAADPEIAAVYKTKAYVARKDGTYTLAQSKYNGDVKAAEKEYLTAQYQTIKDYVAERNKTAQEEDNVVANQQKAVLKQKEEDNDNMYTDEYLEYLNNGRQITQEHAKQSEDANEQVNGSYSSTATLQGGSADDDIDSLRRKVDIGNTVMFMDRDATEAAYFSSIRDYKYSMRPDQVALEDRKHKYRVAEQNLASQNRLYEKEIQHQYDLDTKEFEHGLKNGTLTRDKNGNVVSTGLGESSMMTPGFYSGAGAEDAQDLSKLNAEALKEFTNDYGKDFMLNLTDLYLDEVKKGRLTEKEALYRLHSYKFKSLQEYKDNLAGPKGTSYIMGLGAGNLSKIRQSLNTFLDVDYRRGNNNIYDIVKSPAFANAVVKMDEYTIFHDGKSAVDNKNYNFMRNQLLGEGFKKEDVDAFLNKNGTINSEDVFRNESSKGKRGAGAFNENQFKSIKLSLLSQLSKSEKAQMDAYVLKKLNQNKSLLESDWVPGIISNMSKTHNAQEYRDEWLRNKFMNRQGSESEAMYGKMSTVYKRAHSSNQWATYGAIKTGGTGKAGVYGTDGQMIDVIPRTMQPNTKTFYQIADDVFSRINPADLEVSFGLNADKQLVSGASKSALEYSADQNHKDLALMILRELQLNVGDPKGDLKRFRVVGGTVAGETRNKVPVTILPDREFLQKMAKKDSRITQDVIDAIVQKGITFVAPKNNWTNDLTQQTRITPIQGVVNALGSYKWKHPLGSGDFEVKLDQRGGYKIYYNLYEYDAKAGKMVKLRDPMDPGYTTVPLGNNLDQQVVITKQLINENASLQQDRYNASKRNK